MAEFGKWISVEDKLPPPGIRVLATTGGAVLEAYIKPFGKWYRNGVEMGFWHGKITHWMPLPEPPEEEQKDGV